MPTCANQFSESHHQSGDVINLSEQNSLWKALRKVVKMKRFLNKRKTRKTHLLRFVASTKRQKTLEFLQSHEQQKFYHARIKILETSLQIKLQCKLNCLYPFLHEGNLCMGWQNDFFDETKYPRLVPEVNEIVRFVVVETQNSSF